MDICASKDIEILENLQSYFREYSGNTSKEMEHSLDFDLVEPENYADYTVDEETVQNAVSQLEWEECDLDDEKRIEDFHQKGCGCKLGSNQTPCSTLFSLEKIHSTYIASLELTKPELDLVILACIEACLVNGINPDTNLKHARFKPIFCGYRIYIDTVIFLRGIGMWRLKSLIRHYKNYGVSVPEHGNAQRLPYNTCSVETVKDVATFIDNFATAHALVLPGRVPGFKRTDIRLLPSSYRQAYKEATESCGRRAVLYSKFVELWARLTPFVRVCKPMTDLCFTCQKNISAIQKSANLSDSVKSQVVKEHEQHLTDAETARERYREVSKCNLIAHMLIQEKVLPCLYSGTMHFSFDFAQQIMYPANPQQPGPIFFKTPRKCGLFGICCESLPTQVSYIIDEAVQTGKGENTVISYIHHFLENYGVGECDVHFHTDNCSGQNKNKYLLWYIAWRVIVGLHKNICYSFLLAGHTKFGPDWCFGLLKQTVRKTFVSSLFDIVDAVEKSTSSGTFNWTEFLPQIKSFQNFRFSSKEKGLVYFKYLHNCPEKSFQLLRDKKNLPPRRMPAIIPPAGLDADRQQYLYQHIRPFCRDGTEDLVAPLPQSRPS